MKTIENYEATIKNYEHMKSMWGRYGKLSFAPFP